MNERAPGENTSQIETILQGGEELLPPNNAKLYLDLPALVDLEFGTQEKIPGVFEILVDRVRDFAGASVHHFRNDSIDDCLLRWIQVLIPIGVLTVVQRFAVLGEDIGRGHAARYAVAG